MLMFFQGPVVARRMFDQFGRKAIIGVTVTTLSQAKIAIEDGADYLGIGTVYATPT